MNTRIISMVLRHSLLASASVTAYALYNERLGRELKSKIEFLPVTGNESCNHNCVSWQRDKVIINEAFKDVGWQNPLYVSYGHQFTGCFTHYNDEGVQSAYVIVRDEDFNCPTTKDVDLYSVMGHEAIHSVHKDVVQKAMANGFALYVAAYAGFRVGKALNLHNLWLKPAQFLPESTAGMLLLLFTGVPQAYLGLTAYSISFILLNAAKIATIPFGRYQETRADKDSARLLGTGEVLANWLEERTKNSRRNALDVHPAPAVRTEYLRKLAAETSSTPKIFQSKAYQQLASVDWTTHQDVAQHEKDSQYNNSGDIALKP